MSVSSTEMRFVQVVDDYIAGKMTKEQTLELLKSRYEAVHKDIRKELGEDHISFCCYVPCEFEEWIEICDGAERNKPLPDRLNNGKIIQNVIDKVTANYRDVLKLENWESKADCEIWQEVHHIQSLCRENREITEYYEKYVLEIKSIFDTQPPKIPALEDHYLMQILKHEARPTYEYLKKAINIKLVEYTATGCFDFLCDRGCVGYFFGTAGYSDFKRISPYILANGEPCDVETLRNGSKHGNTKEWNAISNAIFGKRI